MDDVNVLNYLSERKGTNAEFAAEWTEIELLFEAELWSELTTKLILLIRHPAHRNENCLVQLYRNFISSFETKIDPCKLVDIISEVTNFMSDKKQAVEFLDHIEDTVKVCDDAVWHCHIIKGHIHLNHFDDLDATKKILNNLSFVVGKAADVPVHWKMFLLASSYYQRVGDQYTDNYRQLEQKFNTEIDKFNREIERLNKENENFNDKIASQRQAFYEQIVSVQTEMEGKFTTEAVQNFEEVINSQTEVSNLRKLNGRLLIECSQLRNQRNGLEDDKNMLEAKLETIIMEQEQQKNALMLMGALLEKLSLKKDNDESGSSNEPGQ